MAASGPEAKPLAPRALAPSRASARCSAVMPPALQPRLSSPISTVHAFGSRLGARQVATPNAGRPPRPPRVHRADPPRSPAITQRLRRPKAGSARFHSHLATSNVAPSVPAGEVCCAEICGSAQQRATQHPAPTHSPQVARAAGLAAQQQARSYSLLDKLSKKAKEAVDK